ncbi:cysteine synthase family protein [Adhaeribacter swui]|uniref:Cysteine synthase family protein n=1 Tax=Adhaeribacter swui TaxID=2086471 RepID=A0A7G7G9L6_9BACT|nr:cysteine synthase family protein [Adhaeribacter swui]QNF33850.1 cysteine synthase family protein [Adhaeribacter swui]
MLLTAETQDLQEQLTTLSSFIGNTPLFPITRAYSKPGVKIYAKLEWQQLGGSVKARPAFRIIQDAVKSGRLQPGQSLLDASSGNTAIAYAAIGAATQIPVTICLPENASEERKTLLKAFGANIIYTSRFGSTDEAQEIAKQLNSDYPDRYFYADQYGNQSNWQAHYHTTANEIFRQTKGEITHFVAGLGTTGTFTGTSRKLKELNPEIELISLQPDAAMHGLEGWKHLETARVPKIYDATIANQNLAIDTYEAFDLIQKVAQKEGLLVSPSAAANLAGAIKVAESIDEGVIVTVFPDNAEKYAEVLKSLF